MNSSLSASGRTFVSLFCNFKAHRLILSAVHAILNVDSNLSLKGNLFNSPSISGIYNFVCCPVKKYGQLCYQAVQPWFLR